MKNTHSTTPAACHWNANRCMYGFRVLFFIFTVLFLGVYNREILYKTQNFSLFIGDAQFLSDLLHQQGGLLVYASRFLTQFFYFPLVGAILAALCLSLLEWSISKLTAIPQRYAICAFIPSLLLLAAQTTVGYYLYLRFEPSFIFLTVLGVLWGIGAFALYRCVKSPLIQPIAAILLLIVVYLTAGSFAWLFLACLLGYTFHQVKRSIFLIRTICYLVVTVLIAWMGYHLLYFSNFSDIILSPVPQITFIEPVALTILAALYLATLCWYPSSKTAKADTATVTAPQAATPTADASAPEVSASKCSLQVSAGLLLACCLCVFIGSYRDSNFRCELKLQHQFENFDWEGMLQTTQNREHPTKAIAAYRAIALAYQQEYGLLSRDFFEFDYDYVPLKCRLEVPEGMIYLPDLELCTSLPNSAYRWSVEYAAEYGQRPAWLKSMATAALINREIDLATKHIKTLNESLFHQFWALQYAPYIDNIHELYQHPFFKRVIDYVPEEDTIEECNGISLIFAYAGEDPVLYERAMMAALYYKRIEIFCAKLTNMPDEYKKPIPVAFQEAIAFAGLSLDSAYLETYKVDPTVLQRVKNFQTELNATSDWDSAKEILKEKYRYTVPYFFIFNQSVDYNFPHTTQPAAL